MRKPSGTPIHAESHPKAGQTVRYKLRRKHPQIPVEGEYQLEDWWDRVAGVPWGEAQGNPACLFYALTTGFSEEPIPSDNEVVYGKVGAFGHLLHVSEIVP
jgi:hypothetical protein